MNMSFKIQYKFRFRAYLKTIQSYVFQSVSEKINPLDYCNSMLGSCGIDVQSFQKAVSI